MKSASRHESLRHLPAVEAVLQDAPVAEAGRGLARRVVVEAVRGAVEEMRQRILAGQVEPADAESLRRAVVAEVCRRLREGGGRYYRKAINATGIILHTGLGRAVLAPAAREQIAEELAGYALLQADVETGQRDRRDGRIEALLRQLTGCAAATVVNNNAAATWIVLNTVAAGREVIVSRGQLVEIGGSFRLPEVMAASGARLVEVGTTNKTHPRDYVQAITPNTAALLRVHPSNYRITGFTAEVPLEELARIAQAHQLVLIDDVGAGPLVDFSRFGFEHEPTLPESVRTGADLVTCSADKLIGGPQGGLILGRADLVEAVRKNPMARIVRVDKLTLAALEATLSLFLDESRALTEVPTLRMLRRTLAELDAQAGRIAAALLAPADRVLTDVIDGQSQMGSGSLPGQDLPTRLVALSPVAIDANELAARLRCGRPPVFARIHRGRLLIDPRTLLPGEEEPLVAALRAALAEDFV